MDTQLVVQKYKDWQMGQPNKRTVTGATLFKMFDTIFYKTKGYQAESRPVINNVRTRIIILPTIELCKIAFLTYIKEPDWYLPRAEHKRTEHQGKE